MDPERQPPIRVYATEEGIIIMDQQDPERSEPDIITLDTGEVDGLIERLRQAKAKATEASSGN
jgi:hypothetical protein